MSAPQKNSNRPSLDIMNIETIDLTFNKPQLQPTQQNLSSSPRVSKKKPIVSRKQVSAKQASRKPTPAKQASAKQQTEEEMTNPWWHMGTTQYHNSLRNENPNDFSWALRTGPALGGLNFGLKLSGSTMPFSGRKKGIFS